MRSQSSFEDENPTAHPICDGRRKKDRVVRKDYHCTGCGLHLPESKAEWGLIWDSQVHGFCKRCLDETREYAGVSPKKKKRTVRV